jgi:hypothetical protein
MVFCMVESKIPPIVYVFAFWVVKMLIYDFFLQDCLGVTVSLVLRIVLKLS